MISSEASNLQVLALRLLLWGWAWVGKFLWNIGQTFCQYHFPKLDTSVLLVEISLCGALRQLQLKEEWQNRKQSSLHNITFLVLRQEKISLLVFSPKYQQILRRQYCLNGNLKKVGRPSLPLWFWFCIGLKQAHGGWRCKGKNCICVVCLNIEKNSLSLVNHHNLTALLNPISIWQGQGSTLRKVLSKEIQERSRCLWTNQPFPLTDLGKGHTFRKRNIEEEN